MHGRAAKWNYYIETTGAQVQHVARGALPRVCIDACGRRDRKTTTYTHSTGMREISRRNRTNKTKMLWLRGLRLPPAGATMPPYRCRVVHRAACAWRRGNLSCCEPMARFSIELTVLQAVVQYCTTTLLASAVDGAWPSTARLVKGRTFHAPNQQRAGGWTRAPFLRAYTAPVGLSCVRYRLRRWSPAHYSTVYTHCTTVVTVDVYIRAAGLVSLPAASGCVRGHATKLRSGLAFAMWQCSSANTTG